MSKYKNKFFDKINYKNSCIENLFYKMKGDKREKKWKKQRKKYGGFDERCSWNLNWFMTEHIYTWLKMYMKHADGFIDLSFHKFQINGEEKSEREAILEIISDLEYVLLSYDSDVNEKTDETLQRAAYAYDNERAKEAMRRVANAYMILGIIYPSLWW